MALRRRGVLGEEVRMAVATLEQVASGRSVWSGRLRLSASRCALTWGEACMRSGRVPDGAKLLARGEPSRDGLNAR